MPAYRLHVDDVVTVYVDKENLKSSLFELSDYEDDEIYLRQVILNYYVRPESEVIIIWVLI